MRSTTRRSTLKTLTIALLAAVTFAPSASAANITVNTLVDVVDGLDGLCSLREAITASNTNLPSGPGAGECPAGTPNPGFDGIRFQVAGQHLIDPALGVLPTLTDGRCVIDGWSAPGALPGNPPRVQIDGALLPAVNGLTIRSAENQIRGINLVHFALNAIRLENLGTDKNWIYSNVVGTNPAGTAARPNLNGISLNGGPQSNIIGTNGDGFRDRAETNLVSSNDGDGISLTGSDTQFNRIAGNRIGTNRRGTVAMPNASDGIAIGLSAAENFIGTDSSGDAFDADEGNLISGNTMNGINQFSGSNTVIAGNRIGTNRRGTAVLANQIGIRIESNVTGLRIGTDGDGVSDDAEQNLISGNTVIGIDMRGNDHLVAGNLMGTDATGTVALTTSIAISASDGPLGGGGQMTIGGPDERFRNVISGQTIVAIEVTAADVVVECNFLGTDITGTLPLGNGTGVNVTSGLNTDVLRNRIMFNEVGIGANDSTESHDNILDGNNFAGVHYSGAAVTDALDNWWGDPSGPIHPLNPGGTGDEALEVGGGMIDYNPWLVAEPTLCEVPAQ